MRRVAVLMNPAPDDPQAQGRLEIFLQELRALGWTEGHNVQVELRWAGGDAARVRRHAAELVGAAPDVILTTGGFGVGPLRAETRTIPIVFVSVPDPVGSGFVDSLARPGGNATGFTQFEYGISAKWLELLKEISPNVTRVAILRDSTGAAGVGQFAVIQAVAQPQGIETRSLNVRDPTEIERDVADFAGSSPPGSSGMIVASSTNALVHRELIVKLAARHKQPTVYAQREFVAAGGLISYGANITALLHNAAGYADRILKGAKPADLPVQAPTKFELVINTKTALTLGLEFPPTVLARAEDATQ